MCRRYVSPPGRETSRRRRQSAALGNININFNFNAADLGHAPTKALARPLGAQIRGRRIGALGADSGRLGRGARRAIGRPQWATK